MKEKRENVRKEKISEKDKKYKNGGWKGKGNRGLAEKPKKEQKCKMEEIQAMITKHCHDLLSLNGAENNFVVTIHF